MAALQRVLSSTCLSTSMSNRPRGCCIIQSFCEALKPGRAEDDEGLVALSLVGAAAIIHSFVGPAWEPQAENCEERCLVPPSVCTCKNLGRSKESGASEVLASLHEARGHSAYNLTCVTFFPNCFACLGLVKYPQLPELG